MTSHIGNPFAPPPTYHQPPGPKPDYKKAAQHATIAAVAILAIAAIVAAIIAAGILIPIPQAPMLAAYFAFLIALPGCISAFGYVAEQCEQAHKALNP